MANMENGSGSGLNIDKIIGFCKKNVKYISGGVLLVALVLLFFLDSSLLFRLVLPAGIINSHDRQNDNKRY